MHARHDQYRSRPLNEVLDPNMAASISERELLAALEALRAYFLQIPESSSDFSSAVRSLRLLERYTRVAANKSYCYSLGADLTRGIGEWAWSKDASTALDPIVGRLLTTLDRHLNQLESSIDP
jgi:hypothetical protein